ncbi:MAG: hypothetical protein H0V37_06430, partial [Chloroflexia bacterium]|nr:hypothetical protein [Chloroflexia bacterium]
MDQEQAPGCPGDDRSRRTEINRRVLLQTALAGAAAVAIAPHAIAQGDGSGGG